MKKEVVSNPEIYDKINKILSENWQVPQEGLTNSMTITPNRFKLSFRFNNYRRQIKVKTKNSAIISAIQSAIGSTTYSQHTKLLFIKNYKPNITIQYGRNILTGIYSQDIIDGRKQVVAVESDTIQGLNDWLDRKTGEIASRIDAALDDFISRFNLSLRFQKAKWTRKELEVKGEDYIDSLPKDLIIHDTVFKKVYPKGIEFKSEVNAKHYIKNRAIEDISPEIVKELNKMNSLLLDNRKDHLNFEQLVENINSVEDGMKFKESIKKLDDQKQFDLGIILLKKRVFG